MEKQPHGYAARLRSEVHGTGTSADIRVLSTAHERMWLRNAFAFGRVYGFAGSLRSKPEYSWALCSALPPLLVVPH